ncbi:DUF7002 family protein [Pseudomonas benzopyrenica]|uniref:DUF7002 family protein n=1 Tax=Pseudomonas benzopyrenica TaxID=2993566 RepID=UPI0039C31992
MRVDRFISRHPKLFHVTSPGAWQSIEKHGLLSTSAALDLCKVIGRDRKALEEQHRPIDIAIGSAEEPLVLKNQASMPPHRPQETLPKETSTAEWYKFTNGRVFMWADERRVFRLLNARAYRKHSHEVLIIDTESIVHDYLNNIKLCRMNSGSTFPIAHQRKFSDFLSIE